jgi:lysozyme family protein
MSTLSELWHSCKITDQDRFVWSVNRIHENQSRYEQVEGSCGVPWQVIAALHHREASGSFKCHLHNGDPLTARTVHVPSGRPAIGQPPFSWEYSAADALNMKHLRDVNWKDLDAVLDAIERYNGLGYRHKGLPSPYLWAGTDVYHSGKYVADGHYDPLTVDMQPGCVGILKNLRTPF